MVFGMFLYFTLHRSISWLQTRIPVTVLTGVLGAGKTTLLKCHSQGFNGLQNGTWSWKLLGIEDIEVCQGTFWKSLMDTE